MKISWFQPFLSLSLRTQLILLAFLLALPSLAMIFHSVLAQRKDAYNNGLNEAKGLVYNIAFEQYNLTSNTEQLLRLLAQLPDVKKRDVPAVNEILSNIVKTNNHYVNIVIADAAGAVWASSHPLAKPAAINATNLTDGVLKRKQFSSGSAVINKRSGKTTGNFLYPVLNQKGQVEDIISLDFTFDYLNDLLRYSKLSDGLVYTLFGGDGSLIGKGPGKRATEENSEEIFMLMKNGPDEDSFVSGVTGDNEILTYRKLRLQGEESPYVYVLARIPYHSTLTNAHNKDLKRLFLLSSYMLLAIILTIPIANYCFVNRIKKLQEASHLLAAGNLQIRVSEHVRGAEIGALGESFDEMARQLTVREQSIRESREELDDLYNNAPCGYHSLDRDGMIVRMNSTELKRLGYPQDTLVGVKKFVEIVARGDRAKFEENFSTLKTKGRINDLELELLRSDGSILPVLFNATVLYDSDGTFLLSRSTTHDITRRREAEEKLYELNKNLSQRVDEEIERRIMNERLLARNARLAAIGEMIGAIAHQWRQPLATLGVTVQSIRMAWEKRCMDDTFLENAEADAQMQLNYMSDTIEDFRNFFSHEKLLESFDVKEKINEVISLVAAQFVNSGVSLKLADDSPGVPMEIRGYQNEFKQSVLNLVSNAFDAVNAKTRETKQAASPADSNGLIVISLINEADRAIVEVIDNGCGIPDEYAEKVFEPYFTSKSKDKGSGIGLYMTRLIIEESLGGYLGFTSSPDGTTFRIEVPREFSGEGSNNV